MERIEKNRIVAIVEQRSTAMDYTPIYRIKITHALQCGDILEWDKAEEFVRYIEDAKRSRHHD